jgi:YesN/AraC family two-component response regulator
MELLVKTKLTVTEICFGVGYTDASSFCKLFKKRTGHSPENYRQQIKKVIFNT